MKYIVGVSRIIVGFLFILSGLVKLNDPIGFSFKLQDYFAPEVLNLEFLVPYALPMALTLVIVEVLLGVALLIGFWKRLTLWALMLMIVFFTFLTFYSAYFNKVTDCGCFGDAIPLTPWESFWKDVILLILILILIIGQKYIRPVLNTGIRTTAMFLILLGCIGFGYYVLNHLPVIDFRPYKIGANIKEGMEIPEDAPKPLYEYKWKFLVNGKEEIITNHGDYPNVEGEFLDVDTKMLKAGYEPPIHDFTIEREGEDFTDYFLEKENLIVVVAYSLGNTKMKGYKAVKEVTDRALKMGYEVIGLSASSQTSTERLVEEQQLNFDFYFCDETTLKTIIRSNPGIMEVNRAVVKQKFHWKDARKLKLKEVKSSDANLEATDTSLIKEKLEEIYQRDKKLNKLLQSMDIDERVAFGRDIGLSEAESTGDLAPIQSSMDSLHLEIVEDILKTHGYPGKSMVGESNSEVAWNILQRHPDKIVVYKKLIEDAGREGEIPMTVLATMQDRILMHENKPQLYGTQAYLRGNGEGFIWPVENPEEVNERRKEMGFETTVEEYGKEIFGEDFQYEVLTMDQVND